MVAKLCAYAVGVTSSRRLAKLVQRDVGVMMLAAGNRPDFRTLASLAPGARHEYTAITRPRLQLRPGPSLSQSLTRTGC